MGYEVNAPKYFTGQTVNFEHHNKNLMSGKIVVVETHYGTRLENGNPFGFHVYAIVTPTATKRAVWIGENKIVQVLSTPFHVESEMKKLETLFKEHQEFAKSKFPKSTWRSSLDGLKREILEVENAGAESEDFIVLPEGYRKILGLEYVDCFMYLLDSMNRLSFTVEELRDLFEQKLEINKKREWSLNDDGSYSHVN